MHPPVGKEQNKPSTPHVVTPKTQQPQSVAPNKERMNSPSNWREVGPPSTEKGEKAAPPVHKEFGIAPQHGGQSVAPPVHSQGMTQAPVQSTTKPPVQGRELGK
jgi:hypothetical protein